MGDEVICYFVNPDNETVECNGVQYEYGDRNPDALLPPSNGQFWMYLILYGFLVCFAG